MRHAPGSLVGCLVCLLAPTASAAADTGSPLLKVDSSFAFPAHCESGGCVEASRLDLSAFLYRDGSMLAVTSAVTASTRWRSDREVGKLSEAESETLLSTLLENGIRRQGDCEMGGQEAPTGEEVWTRYSWSPGAYNRFRILFVLQGTSGLPRCPESVQRIRAAALAALP